MQHTWMDKSAGQALSQTMAGPTTLIEVDHSGHHLYIDNSSDFNSHVLNVIDRLSPQFIRDHAHTHTQVPARLHHHKPSLEEGGGVTEKVLTE